MKKTLFFGACLCMAVVLTGCKTSKESDYKKAYEKAKAAEAAAAIPTEEPVVAAPVVETPVATPVVAAPVVETPAPSSTDKVAVRTEKLSVVDGSALKNFSVVVGAFSLQQNALGLAAQLRNAGYDARVAFNADRNIYRVVASSFDTKDQAVQSRDQLRSKYPDAWLLYQN